MLLVLIHARIGWKGFIKVLEDPNAGVYMASNDVLGKPHGKSQKLQVQSTMPKHGSEIRSERPMIRTRGGKSS